MQSSSLTSRDIIQRIKELVPPGASEPQDFHTLTQLQQLTQALIQEYQNSGRLQGDPFNEAWTRPLSLYESEVKQQIQNKVILVTGGEGYVGSRLISKLVELGAKRIISIDNARCDNAKFSLQPIVGCAPNVALYAADVRNFDDQNQIFELEKPNFVFHLAAIRIPGLAEKIILTTVTTNIFGTQNIIQLCEAHHVEQCIFSSTGKASRYWTAEVYAASKKMAEWMFAEAAQIGTVQYGMVRFTHMLNNSSMIEQIDGKVEQGKPVNIHAPDRYVVGQNVAEAVHLLLNAVIMSEPKRLRFILVRNLGWPTESLEVALYKIMKSEKKLPIFFQGLPPGYEESFFLGQVDWNNPMEINTLVNALETEYYSTISSTGEMIITETVPFSLPLLNQHLHRLKPLCEEADLPQVEIKKQLGEAIREISISSFIKASPQRALQILFWGINLKQYDHGEFCLQSYQPFIEVVVKSLYKRITLQTLTDCDVSVSEFEALLDVLDNLPTLQAEILTMRELTRDQSSIRKAA
jgi:nucleoside-diphosphate-sugar epimerase